MNAAAKLDECPDEFSGGKTLSRLGVEKSNGGGGGVDEVFKRLGAVESTVAEIRTKVTGMGAVLPSLATKADLTREISALRTDLDGKITPVRAEISGIAAILAHLATKADVTESETSVVKWIIGIIIAVAGLAFTIGRYGH